MPEGFDVHVEHGPVDVETNTVPFRAELRHFGVPVRVTQMLPLAPSPGEDARRLVRHGMAEVVAWLEPTPNSVGAVGPKPGEATHAMLVGDTLVVSAEFAAALKARYGLGDHGAYSIVAPRRPFPDPVVPAYAPPAPLDLVARRAHELAVLARSSDYYLEES